MTSLIIKRQTIANMESDMDRWIQDRDRLSKQLEKCQMKYDNAVILQKVVSALISVYLICVLHSCEKCPPLFFKLY